MQSKPLGHWQKALWKILTNPTVEVVAAIVVVLVAAWIVVDAEVDMSHARNPFPLLFGFK